MSWFSELINGGKNPSDEANKYLNQIPGTVSPYYQPYINQGQEANKTLMEQYGKLIGDPNALYNQFSSGYKESPGYQTRLQEALRGVTNAQAAGGMAGSPQHQQLAAQKAVDLQGQDFENYLNHILGMFGLGLQGEEGLGKQGFEASTGLGDILGSNLGAQAQYGYAGQAGKNANRSNLFGNALKFGTSLVPGANQFASGLNLLPNRSYG